jgi:DNA replication protein DnaC
LLHLPDFDALIDYQHRKIIGKCVVCHATGWIHEDIDDFHTKQLPCECRKRASYKMGLVAGNIPPEFWKVEDLEWTYNLDNLERVYAYCADLPSARSEGRGFTMTGENGAGKTGMACVILSAALRAGYRAAYLTAHDYLTTIPATWRDTELKEWLNELIQADFLVLDEMGKEFRAAEASKLAEVDSLLRARRGAMKPTIAVSNLSLKGFREVYGSSIDSILADRNKRLLYEPGDFRKRKKGVS